MACAVWRGAVCAPPRPAAWCSRQPLIPRPLSDRSDARRAWTVTRHIVWYENAEPTEVRREPNRDAAVRELKTRPAPGRGPARTGPREGPATARPGARRGRGREFERNRNE